MSAYNFNRASAAALQHWYEIAPEEARLAVMKEIVRPKPRFNAGVLGMLPEQELPEIEQALAEHLNSDNYETRSNVASLIERYATAALEPRVTAFLGTAVGRMECDTQTPLLAYLLRVDPQAARSNIQAAMAARGEGYSACNHMLLPEVARLHKGDILQDAAIQGLNDPDPEVVASAANYLMEFGSASTEDLLWARFTSWSERWKGRESELQDTPGQKMDGTYELMAGNSLMQALAAGHAWVADEAKLRRLVDLSIGPQQRQQAQQYLGSSQPRPEIILFLPVNEGYFQLGQYEEHSLKALEEKLLQYPKGSSFQWIGGGTESGQKQFEELANFAREHGMKVTKAESPAAK
jgi:hypothetical protein